MVLVFVAILILDLPSSVQVPLTLPCFIISIFTNLLGVFGMASPGFARHGHGPKIGRGVDEDSGQSGHLRGLGSGRRGSQVPRNEESMTAYIHGGKVSSSSTSGSECLRLKVFRSQSMDISQSKSTNCFVNWEPTIWKSLSNEPSPQANSTPPSPQPVGLDDDATLRHGHRECFGGA